MQSTDVLSFGMGNIGSLERPVMLVGLEGWFDVASAATAAVNAFTSAYHAVVVGSIDPDPFYDFTQQRPHVTLDDGVREIVWPTNDFVLQRGGIEGPKQSLTPARPPSRAARRLPTWRPDSGCHSLRTRASPV